MDIKVIKKSVVNIGSLVELTYIAMKKCLPSIGNTIATILGTISERIARDCYDLVFIAEDQGKMIGCAAFYDLTDLGIAQLWEWHPVVLPGQHEDEVAVGLLQAAFSQLKQTGIHKVTIDFQVNEKQQGCLSKYLNWYARTGIVDTYEEIFLRNDLNEQDLQIAIPDEYSLGYISETGLDDLFNCWLKIFSSSEDEFFLSLDDEGRRTFFFESWSREKPLIHEASLTLYHKGKLIGFSRLLPIYKPSDGYLAPIGILSEYRKKGLAQELLKMSMHRLKESNYQTMSCYVSNKNAAALSFYEKLGFKPKHRITSLFGDIG